MSRVEEDRARVRLLGRNERSWPLMKQQGFWPYDLLSVEFRYGMAWRESRGACFQALVGLEVGYGRDNDGVPKG